MRRRATAAGLAATALLLIAGLGSTALAASGTGGTLEGHTWVLQRYAVGNTVADVPSGVDANATFADGRVSGAGGCNRFSGDYTASGASLTFGPLLSTMMACGTPQDDVEQAYLAALGKVATYTATATTLTMYDAAGQAILTFEARSNLGLAKVAWHLTSYNNGKQAVVSVITGTDPTATFGEDGTVAGNATCNQFFGPFTATGTTIKIGPLGSTMMACPTTEQQDQESAYLAALEASTTWMIEGSNLELRDASGALQARFTAVVTEPMPLPATTSETQPTAQPTPPPTSTATGGGQGGLPVGILAILGAAFLAAMVLLPLRTARNR